MPAGRAYSVVFGSNFEILALSLVWNSFHFVVIKSCYVVRKLSGYFFSVFFFLFPAFTSSFLDSCSNELWFRTAVNLFQHKGLDPKILEKLSIVLQRLSKVR